MAHACVVVVLALTAGTLVALGARAATPAPWTSIATIYYDAAADDRDPDNRFLEKAAGELRSHLESVAGRPFAVTTSSPSAPAVRLRVAPGDGAFAGRSDDAYRLFTDGTGYTVTGKSPMGARHGAYALLEKLGFRWLGNHPAWNVKPTGLADLYLDEVQSPRFVQRDLIIPRYNIDSPLLPNGRREHADWLERNRLVSPTDYVAHHSWENFIDPASVAAQDRSAVCYLPDGRPRQALPDHPLVRERARNHGRYYVQDRHWMTLERPRNMAVPISPNDGEAEIWCDEWKVNGRTNSQVITDKVFGLANEVARVLQTERPGKKASVLSYAWYNEIPSFPLESNLYVKVADFVNPPNVNGTQPTTLDRIRAFKGKGLFTGAYYFFSVYRNWRDRVEPPGKLRFNLDKVREAAAGGADTFTAEITDNWSSQGRLYWVTSKLLWDSALDSEALLDDYYTKAFGPAKAPMKRYFERFDNQPQTERAWGLAFRDLDEALRLASADPGAAERVRHILYHARFWRLWGSKIGQAYTGFSGVEEAKDLYRYLWRIKDLHVVTFVYQEAQVRNVLKTQYGLTDASIAALQNATPPSPPEARTWLDGLVSTWQGQDLVDAAYVDPGRLQLRSAGADARPVLPRFGLSNKFDLIVPSPGSEQVTVKLLGRGVVEWIAPSGEVLSKRYVNNYCDAAGYCFDDRPMETLQFPAAAPGNYTFRFGGGHGPIDWYERHLSEDRGFVEVPGRLAGVRADSAEFGWWSGGSTSQYFHVPSGTASLVVAATTGQKKARSINMTLTRPDGTQLRLSSARSADDLAVRDPAPGTWRVDVATDSPPGALGDEFFIFGVPALSWHDAAYLMAGTAPVATDPVTAAPPPAPAPPTGGPDAAAPAAPTGLRQVAATCTTIQLAWSPAADNVGVAGYHVYRWNTGARSFLRIGSAPGTSFTATGLPADSAQYVYVTAYDAAGNESAKSNDVDGWTPACAGGAGASTDTVAPTAPSGLRQVAATCTTIQLAWSPAADSVGVAGYHVYRWNTGARSFLRIGSAPGTSFTATGLPADSAHYVYVTAYDAAGNESAKSNDVDGWTPVCGG